MSTSATRAGERRPADSTVEELERDRVDETVESPNRTLQGAASALPAAGASTRKKAREAAEQRQYERALANASEGRGPAVVAATTQKSKTQQGAPPGRPPQGNTPPGLAATFAASRKAEDDDSDDSDDSPSDGDACTSKRCVAPGNWRSRFWRVQLHWAVGLVDGDMQLVAPPRVLHQNPLTQIVGTMKVEIALSVLDLLGEF